MFLELNRVERFSKFNKLHLLLNDENSTYKLNPIAYLEYLVIFNETLKLTILKKQPKLTVHVSKQTFQAFP